MKKQKLNSQYHIKQKGGGKKRKQKKKHKIENFANRLDGEHQEANVEGNRD